jgi:hypothetical protein
MRLGTRSAPLRCHARKQQSDSVSRPSYVIAICLGVRPGQYVHGCYRQKLPSILAMSRTSCSADPPDSAGSSRLPALLSLLTDLPPGRIRTCVHGSGGGWPTVSHACSDGCPHGWLVHVWSAGSPTLDYQLGNWSVMLLPMRTLQISDYFRLSVSAR